MELLSSIWISAVIIWFRCIVHLFSDSIRSVAGAAVSPVDQITGARALLDAGAITDAEFRGLKVKALA